MNGVSHWRNRVELPSHEQALNDPFPYYRHNDPTRLARFHSLMCASCWHCDPPGKI